MKRQLRPFSVEFKGPRRRQQALGTFSSKFRDEWIDPFADDVPEWDVHRDLISADAATTLQVTQAGTSSPRRILPDLLTEARDQKQPEVDQPVRPRAPKRSASTAQPRLDALRPRQADVEVFLESTSPSQVHDTEPVHVAASIASVGLTVSERSWAHSRHSHKLASGERWKGRRLPRICWDR